MTLDEVIKTIDEMKYYPCDDCCVSCNYKTNECFVTDALHYLQTYRADKLEWEQTRQANEERYQEVVRNCERAENKFIARLKELDIGTMNNPLTWDELKQMEGKPVWVEYDGYKPMWDIVDKIIDKRTIETYKCMLHEEGIGIYWQAYRKERE